VNIYPFIEAEKSGDHNVSRACVLLQVSRAAYYAHRGNSPSARQRVDAELTAQIRAVHAESKGHLRRPPYPRRTTRSGPPARPQTGGPADALRRGARPDAEAAEDHDCR
jgi:hypothetical protein